MRLFVAILPPPAARDELAGALGALRRLPGAADLRWTVPDSWHFTLAFLGEVPDHVRPELDRRLARAAGRHGPFTLRLSGGGRFGDRALWAGADGDVAGVARLAASVRAAARRAGAPADEEHGFTAHLTLARAGRARPVPLRPFADALAAYGGSPWNADTLHLMGSIPPRSGVPGEKPQYRSVLGVPLGRPGDEPPDRDR